MSSRLSGWLVFAARQCQLIYQRQKSVRYIGGGGVVNVSAVRANETALLRMVTRWWFQCVDHVVLGDVDGW